MSMQCFIANAVRASAGLARISLPNSSVAASIVSRRNLATTNSEFVSVGPGRAVREYERAVQQAREVFQHTRDEISKQSPTPSRELLRQALEQLNHDVALAKKRYLFATLDNKTEVVY